jgi:hypothetical protein
MSALERDAGADDDDDDDLMPTPFGPSGSKAARATAGILEIPEDALVEAQSRRVTERRKRLGIRHVDLQAGADDDDDDDLMPTPFGPSGSKAARATALEEEEASVGVSSAGASSRSRKMRWSKRNREGLRNVASVSESGRRRRLDADSFRPERLQGCASNGARGGRSK